MFTDGIRLKMPEHELKWKNNLKSPKKLRWKLKA